MNLLAAKEALAGLRRYRKSPIFQSLLEAPEVRSGRRQQRNIAGPAEAFAGIFFFVADHHVADEPAAGIGNALRFGIAQRRRVRIFVVLHFQRGDRDCLGTHVDGRKLGEAGLSGALRKHVLEPAVHKRQDGIDRAEVGSDVQEAALADGSAGEDVGGHVGAAEPVDRLLGITDQKQRTGSQLPAQSVCYRWLAWLAAQEPEDLDLQRIGILKLVDENMTEPARKRPPDLVMAHEQIAGGVEKIVEIEQRGGAFVVAPIAHQLVHCSGEARQQLGSDRGEQGLEGVVSRFVVHLGAVVGLLPVGL